MKNQRQVLETLEGIRVLLASIKTMIEEEYEPVPAPVVDTNYECPECGSKMKERFNRQNGNKFYGCIKFPDCRGTRDENGLSREERETKKQKEEEYPQEQGYSFNKKRDVRNEGAPS